MRKLWFVLLLGVTACEVPEERSFHDQCLRRELFRECMELVAKTAGPEVTTFNDWDDVVGQCRDEASYASYRRREYIKPECLP